MAWLLIKRDRDKFVSFWIFGNVKDVIKEQPK
jgi:hypothetical protein